MTQRLDFSGFKDVPIPVFRRILSVTRCLEIQRVLLRTEITDSVDDREFEPSILERLDISMSPSVNRLLLSLAQSIQEVTLYGYELWDEPNLQFI